MDAPLALYRRYRPETFAEVIGQEHVTEPLRAALANNRVNHAYLFSGPARLRQDHLRADPRAGAQLREGAGRRPVRRVRELSSTSAAAGAGSIDVIEIDAASHGGVDDARDLREKAFFAPVRSRYKVYIIDEAHMVSTQGFNALLKLVEEPPEHLRFIFATTEPDKVIPTIRSRTHHYPFRLIPPRLLSSYLTELCEQEGVQIDQAALPLVVRAGAGSARDTLSVLDQLIGGAGARRASPTTSPPTCSATRPTRCSTRSSTRSRPATAARSSAVVDKVIETGQDPRRFTEDLLRRLRDLVIVDAVPEATASGLIDVSEDQGERLVAQAARFGSADLSRAADIVATGLTEMRGATAPRLLLELICARVLLPGADHTTLGLGARLDRLERRLDISGTPPRPPRHGTRTGARSGPGPARRPARARQPGADRRRVAGDREVASRRRRPDRRARARGHRPRRHPSPSPSPRRAAPRTAPRRRRRARSAWSTYAASGPTSSRRPRSGAGWPGSTSARTARSSASRARP